MKATAAVAGFLVVSAMPARASDAAARLLDTADHSYAQLDFAGAAVAYEDALRAGGMSGRDLTRTYAGIAATSAALGKAGRAQWAFERLLTIAPDWTPPEGASPKVLGPFQKARAEAKRRGAVKFDARSSREGSSILVEVEVAADPLHLIQELQLDWRLPAGGIEHASSRTPPRWSLHIPGDAASVTARALTEGSSVVSEVAVAVLPPVAEAPPPPEPGDRRPAEAPSPSISAEPSPPVEAPTSVKRTEPEPSTTEPSRASVGGGWNLSAYAEGFRVVTARSAGAEIGVLWSPLDFLELGVNATAGSTWGVQLSAAVSPFPAWAVQPFLQLRGNVTPLPDQVTWGGGLGLGAALRVWRMRALVEVAAEAYDAPNGYQSMSVLVLAGGAFDLWRREGATSR